MTGRTGLGEPADRRSVSILIVTFNHAEEIDACLRAALAQANGEVDVEVTVVDNASTDGTRERVAAHSGVRLIDAGHNRGFSAGMNAAFRASSGRWVLILNPDCTMDAGCASALRDHLEAAPGVVVAAALLHHPDGSPQLFARRRTDLATALWEFTHLGRRIDARLLGGRLRARRRYACEWQDGPPRSPLPVFSPAAACVMAARPDLEPAPFDEGLPLLLSDEDLYIRLTRGGRRIEIVPSATAAHGYGTSLGRAAERDQAGMRAQWVWELRQLAARHWRRPARVALFAVLLVDAGFAAVRGLPRWFARGTLGGLGLPGGAPPLLGPGRPTSATPSPRERR